MDLMNRMDLVNLVVLVAIIEYSVFAAVVGSARSKYGVLAPATTGNQDWERLYRVQMNTAEQLIVFLPAIYGFAYYVDETWAAGIGSLFVIGRVFYFYGYRAAAAKRSLGATLSGLSCYALMGGTLFELVSKILG